jgi:hypothetical protein
MKLMSRGTLIKWTVGQFLACGGGVDVAYEPRELRFEVQ